MPVNVAKYESISLNNVPVNVAEYESISLNTVSHPNEIWVHPFLTGMICMIYKETTATFIFV